MSNIMASPYKHPQTGVYYFRMAVPKKLVPIIGKTVFKKSLQTKNLSEAKPRFTECLFDAQKQIAVAQLKLSNSSNVELNVRDCAIIAERWYEHVKNEVDTSGNYDLFLKRDVDAEGTAREFGLSDTLSICGNEVDTATPDQLQELADELKEFIVAQLDREGLVVSSHSESFRQLAVAFYHYIHRIEALCRARYNRDYGYEAVSNPIADKPLSVNPLANKHQPKRKKASQYSISNVFKRYHQSETLKDKDAKALYEAGLQIERLIEVIGDLDVTEVTRAHIVEFRDTLLQLPKSKIASIRNRPLLEQIELVKIQGLETLSATTVKNCLRKTSVVFSYAVELGIIDSNPHVGVRVATAEKKTEANEGKGYTDSEMRRLFQADVFNDVNARKPYGMACYWVPLLCRYTGARLEEMSQLHKSDVSQSDSGIHYLNIRRGEGQSVKNNSSLRHVPIPAHLIELGFLDYVAESVGFLFPELKENKYGKKSAALSKWWGQTVRSLGIHTTQPAHAFRHTFKTALRRLGIADTVSDAITGHTPAGVGGSYGTVELETKREAIDRLPRLALSRLW
ncbi:MULTISPECIES: site-specific integrase [Vibrio harveyi group]|uniref:site-specific integrase n=1 Tax=Vibrio harveyi group TaxID=717610 RepID=UPI000419A881|nr:MULTISPECIES: site-specific integrase [Vibrio harveyi group]EGQ8065510.1 site-specific integrase [Vibrio parahaemolyticus]EHK9545757.1 site-specific integrase [Vibrio alginolyticus]EHK9601907.1 site-specific integrase [Vibrio alginolyticus]ELA8095700.1 site-specific integrase [Vibrio parahaemolyticus]ELB2787485.1 site-specific integrase [Vibrio alginolyticus]